MSWNYKVFGSFYDNFMDMYNDGKPKVQDDKFQNMFVKIIDYIANPAI